MGKIKVLFLLFDSSSNSGDALPLASSSLNLIGVRLPNSGDEDHSSHRFCAYRCYMLALARRCRGFSTQRAA